MQIKEYLDKNLPNINWNIFPQICEKNGFELTDWVKQYLKETPGNTNYNFLKDMIKGKSSKWVTIFEEEITTKTLYSSMGGYLRGYNFSEQVPFSINTTQIKITVDSESYILPLSSVPVKFGGDFGVLYDVDKYFGADQRQTDEIPGFNETDPPYGLACMEVDSDTITLRAFASKNGGTFSIKIEVEDIS
jgi:hypothetical protein